MLKFVKNRKDRNNLQNSNSYLYRISKDMNWDTIMDMDMDSLHVPDHVYVHVHMNI
jgi:hypothetical protein